MYEGKTLRVIRLAGELLEFCFDRQGGVMNRLDEATLDEIQAALSEIAKVPGTRGMVLTSAKQTFMVGTDMAQLRQILAKPGKEIAQWASKSANIVTLFETLPFPTVALINGAALGAGFEVALAADFRVMAVNASVGFPEAKLGLVPCFGGTVRLPRLIGVDNAIEWIGSGVAGGADIALKHHAVDAVVQSAKLRLAAAKFLELASTQPFDWKKRRAQKATKLNLPPIEALMAFESAKGFVAGLGGKNFEAPQQLINILKKAASESREQAVEIEAKGFATVAKSPTAKALTALFFNDQALRSAARKQSKSAIPLKTVFVNSGNGEGADLSALSVDGGYQVFLRGPEQSAVRASIVQASRHFAAQVRSGNRSAEGAGEALIKIRAVTGLDELPKADLLIDMSLGELSTRMVSLADLEAAARPETVVMAVTKRGLVAELSASTKRPSNFVSMNYQGPFASAALVEVVRGPASSTEAVSTAMAFLLSIGKTPLLVRNTPGFLLDRLFAAYVGGWLRLVRDGADYSKVEEVTESLGWARGPAAQIDVTGIDQFSASSAGLASAYPDRMTVGFKSAIDVMLEASRTGAASGIGFHRYGTQGPRRNRSTAPDTARLLSTIQPNGRRDFSEQEIVDRLVMPLVFEAARCVEEQVVNSVADADVAAVLGLGFPSHFGGPLKYADLHGLQQIAEKSQHYVHLGALYDPPGSFRSRQESASGFYPT